MRHPLAQETQGALDAALCLAGDESCDGDLLEAVQRVYDEAPH